MYIEFFMCCLTYSYIAILYSICQCTVLNLLSRGKKKKKKGRKRSVTQPMGTDGTRPVEKEKQGVSESAGGCRKQSSKCCLLISAPATAPQVSRHRSPFHRRRLRFFSAASRLPEDQLRTAVQLICTVGLEFRWGEQERKKKKKQQQRTEKQDRMLIYANAVTQIWKRLVALVGSWTEAWSSHVAPRAWGKLTDSTCTFLLLMFTAR